MPSDGVPYPILVFAALLPWQFFSSSFSEAGNSLISNSNMISKVYFPRITIPASSIIVSFVDFLISLGLLALIMTWYGFVPGMRILLLPLFTLLAIAASFGGFGPPSSALLGLALFTYCYLNLVERQGLSLRLRPVLTSLFGLVHGFGFAAVLMEIGLPPGKLALALFGFNLGVEVGQILVVCLIGAVTFAAMRFMPIRRHRLGLDMVSAALFAIGLYWFVERALTL